MTEEGWTRRFVADPQRLAEAVDLYRSLGLEVRLEPVTADELPPGCHDCTAALLTFRTIHTRPNSGESGVGLDG